MIVVGECLFHRVRSLVAPKPGAVIVTVELAFGSFVNDDVLGGKAPDEVSLIQLDGALGLLVGLAIGSDKSVLRPRQDQGMRPDDFLEGNGERFGIDGELVLLRQ